MPSSTSSFKTYELKRVIPRHHWVLLALMTVGLTAILTLSWELYCRQLGYAPTLNDTEDLWASQRALVDEDPKRTVLIGTSRILFGFNIDVYEDAMGERALQLATVGTNPGSYLQDLADHPEYSGTVIVGVVPSLFFTPGGPTVEKPKNYLKRYREWSPAQRVGLFFSMVLEHRLAFLNQKDLTLNKLLLKLKLPERERFKIPLEFPPYSYQVDKVRQGGLTDQVERNVDFQKRIQQILVHLFKPPPPPENKSQEEINADQDKSVSDILKQTKSRVDKIRSRGGKVVFLRLPSTSEVRDIENEYTPRADYWDQILKVTAAPGIHFEDYEELSGFDCPEWSHLSKPDAIEFTRRLIPLFQELRKAGKM